MQRTIRLGFGIAALFAAGVFVVSVFGNHESWFVRAARENAVRCLTGASCPRLDNTGAIVTMKPPLNKDSRCAKPGAWAEVKAASNGQTRIVVLCANGAQLYLYHMGRLNGGGASQEQWLACRTADCSAEIDLLRQRML